MSCENYSDHQIWCDFAGKSSFVAPLPRTSENGNAPENSTQNIRPISLRPSSLDNVSLQRGVWRDFN